MAHSWMTKKLTDTQMKSLPSRISVEQARTLGILPKLNQISSLTKQSKYRNRRTFYSGRWYDSAKEANRAAELDRLMRAGVVKSWTPQVRFPIFVGKEKICTYIADFKVVYLNGESEYEDVKGFKTDVYKIKKKLVKAVYGIEIKEL